MTSRLLRSIAALGVLSLAGVAAQSDTDPILEFNMTFKANEGLLNYNKGWDLKGDQLFWSGDGEANATRVNYLYLGFGFCAYGEFDPIMNFTTACGPVVGEWTNSTNGTTFCYNHIWGYFDIGLKGGENGVRRLDSVTFFTGLTAPKGATMDDIEITTVPLLDKGMYKNSSVYTHIGGEVEPCNADNSVQIKSGSLDIRPPDNTSFIVIRGPRGPTLGQVQYTINPFPMENNSFAVNVNGPVSPSNSPLYNQPLDPWQRYSILTAPSYSPLGSGYNYTSVDFYTYKPGHKAGKKGKSNAGAIAGGVVGGIVGLALLGVILWFCMRRRGHSSSVGGNEKFQIDENANSTLTPYETLAPLSETEPSTQLSPSTATHSSYGEKAGMLGSLGSYGVHSSLPAMSASGTTAGTSVSGEGTGRLSSDPTFTHPTSKASLLALEERQRRQMPRHDEDVGPLEQVNPDESEAGEEEPDELLPPMYDPSWKNGRLRVRQSSDGRGPRAVAAQAQAQALEETGPTAGASRRMSM